MADASRPAHSYSVNRSTHEIGDQPVLVETRTARGAAVNRAVPDPLAVLPPIMGGTSLDHVERPRDLDRDDAGIAVEVGQEGGLHGPGEDGVRDSRSDLQLAGR
jgi:hypothetical protein